MTCHCGQCGEAPHGEPTPMVLSAFITFLRQSSEVVHIAFVPGFEGVEMPEKQAALAAPMVYIDLKNDHPAGSFVMDDFGLRISVNKSHPGIEVKIPWHALTLLANDFGFSWKNDPLLQAMAMRAAVADLPASKYIH